MSENPAMNFDDRSPDATVRLLAALEPEPLQVRRDELFFQAGVAVGAQSRKHFQVFSLLAAALLLMCLGLGASLAYQTAALHRLQLAAVQRTSNENQLAESKWLNPLPDLDAADGFSPSDRQAFNEKMRRLQLLASPRRLPAGRLTALGWEPRQVANGQRAVGNDRQEQSSDSFDTPDSSQPHRPSTYLDLLRLQQEG